jgi:hypothetical protein
LASKYQNFEESIVNRVKMFDIVEEEVDLPDRLNGDLLEDHFTPP